MTMEDTVTIRVSGLGHKLTLQDLPSASTLAKDLFHKVCEATGLLPRYIKLIGPQKLSLCYAEDDSRCLADLRIQGRTKLILLHSPLYAIEKEAYESLKSVEDEIHELERTIRQNGGATKRIVVQELVTRICCRLDVIDVSGSKDLRNQRKKLLQMAETLEALAETKTTTTPSVEES